MANSAPLPRLPFPGPGDIRFSIRRLRKSPGFALTAILTLALGIGAVTSVFSVVNTVLLKPFAFPDPARLVVMREGSPSNQIPDNYRHFLRLRKDSKTLADAAIFQNHGVSVSPTGDHPHIVGAIAASPNILRVFGVQPIMGRDFVAQDAVKGASSVVILTWNGWQTLFNGDPNVIGQTLRNGGEPSTVIGVLPSGVKFPDIAWASNMPSQTASGAAPEILALEPLVPSDWDLKEDTADYNYKAIARLKTGVTLAQAQAELEGLQQAYTRSAHLAVPLGIALTPFAKDVTSNISTALWLLFAAVGAVLLIACANLANLQLVRAVAAEREIAVRAALGASKGHLVVSRLTESLILAAIGGIGGVAVAFAGVRLLVAVAPANVPRLNEVAVSLPVLFFAVGLSLITALLSGVLPALRSLHVNPQTALGANPSRVANTRQGSATRNLLVATEIACTVVLLVVTGLVLRSFSQLLRQNRGFDSSHVTLAQVQLYAAKYDDSKPGFEAAKAAFVDRTLTALRQLPGVRSAAITSVMPLAGETWIDSLVRPDHPVPEAEQPPINVRWISPEFLQTMGIPLLSGRNFTEADRNNPCVVLLSDRAVHDGFPGEDPIGHKIDNIVPVPSGKTGNSAVTVIGVVANARINGLKDTAAVVYVPYFAYVPWSLSFVVRSSQPSSGIMPEMRRVLWSIDPQVAIPIVKSLDDQVSDSVATDRFQTLLLSTFGAAALLLALLGVYGVLAYSVSLRQQEFGIRIALGSDKSRLTALVLKQAAWPVLAGSTVGLGLAFIAGRWVSSLLYETKPADPIAIAASLALLIGAAALAASLPARRAAQVDPIEVLRNE
ncbi:MAG: ABC transporter permease [Silvibacterium sp.]|nr:ABC transporter permease [Silvibacterium sp.]